jgi:hypothetical protein
MQKEYKKHNQTPVRYFSYLYQDTSPYLPQQQSSESDDFFSERSGKSQSNKLLDPLDHLALLQETVSEDQESQRKSNKQHSKEASSSSTKEENPQKKLENSFAQRYIDEIASTQKMKEYRTIAYKEKANLLKEAKILHQKYNTEVVQSQQIENTVINIASLVSQFATLIQSQTEIVGNIGETTEEVTKSIKSTDEELLLTIERGQKNQWNMIVIILFFSFLLLLIHFMTA